MAEGTLQHVVDSLAGRLGRSVAIDDKYLRLLAASRHFGDQDPMRMRSLLDRELTPANLDLLRAHGIADWTGPGVMEAVPEFGTFRRLCIPLRHLGELFGYLWLIDANATLTPGELELSRQAAGDAALVLHREMLLLERRDARDGALVRDLVSSESGVRSRVVQEIGQDQILSDNGCSAVVVVEVTGADDLAPEDVRDALRRAVQLLARGVPPRSWLHLVEGARLVVVATVSTPCAQDTLASHARTMCGHVEQALHSGMGARAALTHYETDGVRAWAGIGSCGAGIEWAFTSHDQACQALRAGRLLPQYAPITQWEALGVYGVLLKLTSADLTSANYPAALVRLLHADPGGKLVATVEAYLDEAGDAVRAAARLHLHRTTLHYRLRKVEEVAGVNLASGEDRLALHVGIKLAQLGRALPVKR